MSESLDRFTSALERIKNPYVPGQVDMRNDYCGWIQEASGTSRQPEGDIVNAAIALGGWRELANTHGLSLRMLHASGKVYGFCSPVAIDECPDNELVRVNVDLTVGNRNLLDWMNGERGISSDAAVGDGIRLLGAAALMSDVTVCVMDPQNSHDAVKLASVYDFRPLPKPPSCLNGH